ncbi:hypothetical protein B0H14DRAFT_3532361 [Mycena olivaceomarginata]|nr:hypothetical protein B0H14DRAFT_3532361 [Mycena olivaceomarginata]
MSEVEILGTSDVLKIWAWEHQYGFDDLPDEEVFDAFQADSEALVRHMKGLMADKIEGFPHLFPLDTAGHLRQTLATMTTTPSPPLHARPGHSNSTITGGGRHDVKN